MRQCRFCGCEIRSGKTGNASQEHVFPKWLQRRLGVDKNMFNSTKVDIPTGDESTYSHTLNTLTANDVCEGCNNGWMNALELAVAPILEKVFTGQVPVCFLTQDEQAILQKWCFKTALAVIEAVRRKDIVPPDSHFKDMADSQTVPENAHVIINHTEPSPVGMYTPEIINNGGYLGDELVGHYTVVLAFGNLMIGVQYVPPKGHSLALSAGYHIPVGRSWDDYTWYLQKEDKIAHEAQLLQWRYFVTGLIPMPGKPPYNFGIGTQFGDCLTVPTPIVDPSYRPTPIP